MLSESEGKGRDSVYSSLWCCEHGCCVGIGLLFKGGFNANEATNLT